MIVNSVWIGKKLGPVHAACLRSFVRHGHDVVLHSYGRPEDTPDGVRLFDAKKLMGEEEIVRHDESGSLSLAADIYRYRILKAGLGIYVDCDVFCVKPFENHEYLFGYEKISKFNNAVLNIPSNSDLLTKVMACSEDPYFIPPWLSNTKKIRDQVRRSIGLGTPLSKRKWGVIGPELLTYYIHKLNLENRAKSVDAFYPLHHDHIRLLWSKGLTVNDIITPNTFGVHLYNSFIEREKRSVLPDTPLYEIINS
ncbi:hypothetical protein ACLBWZ_08860 [Brucellaceae bacterium C25G]